ncbi:phospholipase D zeta 2-like isoform X3 [Camellia sinensis]|uniref:phospholipase D zeta 2-like isoform X3 n=1 Tax=Camellia sinensis TaxID=4442 RepID=UPI001035ED8C|nr:phospholipase D zeta 2-like isoform X3 [Camellia sinensis]
MSSEYPTTGAAKYVPIQPYGPEPPRIFEELPRGTIVSVSRPDASDISPLQLSYTIEIQYKQFKWRLLKKASQVIYLHFALKKRAIIEELHEKQEQVKEWLLNIGIGDQTAVVHDNDEPDDGAVPIHHEDGAKTRYVPSRAALPIIRPALGAQQTISENAKVAMQGYLNHFLGNMDIVNSREVCKFLEVSKLSFSQEYGPKLKEGYVMVKHLAKIPKDDDCHVCRLFDYCNKNWQKVWAVLKPGFLALLEDPFDTNLLDIIIFDVLPASNKDKEDQVHLAEEIKHRNPLRYAVKIYILLYKEVSIALKINSSYSKQLLVDIHENVKVLRYPDRFPTGIYLWSHHEKLVIVDYNICFIGGLDLCFGRYDTIEHKVGDYPPSIWPGKDYYNPREHEPNSWEDTMRDELDREKYPRMPWHDVHCALWGPACRDIARHFVQRWNHAKRNKAPKKQAIPLLMPHHHMVLPHYMGRSREINVESNTEVKQKDISRQDSFSSRSPLEDIPLLLPPEADNTLNGLDNHQFQRNLDRPSKIGQSPPFSIPQPKVEPLIPDMQMKGVVDDLDFMDLQSETSIDVVAQSDIQNSDEWWETQERGYQDVLADETAQVGPRTPCRCQVIRSVSQWSAGTSQSEDSIHTAYCSLIANAEHFVYIENQFFISGLSGDEIIQNRVLEALYRRILRAHKEQKCFRVVVVIPLLPGFQGGLDDSGAATVRAIMHWQYRTICRGKNSILHNLNALLGPKANDYISFCGLRTYGKLSDGGPVVTSQVYVHSKVLIVDDHITVLGSSNVNDRSLLGSRDSEIGFVIEDKEFVESSMNGDPWKAGKFALSLRLSLWSEHLGLHAGEIKRIRDPIADSTYKDLWLTTAETNTTIYQDVFGCVPNDLIHSRSAFRQSMNHCKERIGYTTIDLGVAPEKLESCEDGETKVTDPMGKLKSLRGFLVLFPLEFLCEEDLRPMFVESEFYTSPQVFH